MNSGPEQYSSELSPRSPWKATVEVMLFSLIFCALAAIILAFPLGGVELSMVWQRAAVAGSVASEHIGVTLGVYATTFLAFYGVVIGAQINRSRMANQTQRFLSLTSELLFGTLAPAIGLITIACIENPSRAGALFAFLPATAILFVVATVLGTFLVFSESERRDSLRRALSQVRQNQMVLPRAGRYGMPVIFCHAATLAVIGTLITGIFNGWTIQPSIMALLGSMYFVVAGGFAAGSAFAVISRQTTQDAFDKVFGTVISVIIFSAGAFLAVSSLLSGLWSVTISLVAMIVLSVSSARTKYARLRNATIYGAATHVSAQSISTELSRIKKRLRELNGEPEGIWLPRSTQIRNIDTSAIRIPRS
ncbi:hypothetical protein [Brevibacterium zhoupengii]|uniref:hypothetical protein n=1 Tax=Brevibacterium zhoupengii TaxID=2898795 RepID=UPI001E3185DF|nr:hypothetical protein [Brevibacterium zhoupengii]